MEQRSVIPSGRNGGGSSFQLPSQGAWFAFSSKARAGDGHGSAALQIHPSTATCSASCATWQITKYQPHGPSGCAGSALQRGPGSPRVKVRLSHHTEQPQHVPGRASSCWPHREHREAATTQAKLNIPRSCLEQQHRGRRLPEDAQREQAQSKSLPMQPPL